MDAHAPPIHRCPLAVLMTTHNRRDLTLACLQALRVSLDRAGIEAMLVVADDGSRDGTPEAVRAAWPGVRLIEGDGNLYWCRGMHAAFEAARPIDPQAYLWLNDDTMLHPDAIARLLDCSASLQGRHPGGLIVVGSTQDANGQPSYGGERQASRWNPLSVQKVRPSDRPQRLDTMNGNIVLVDGAAARRLGNLDPTFEHAMGDTDYGLRAVREGVGLMLAPGVHGTCNGNPVQGGFYDAALPLRRRLAVMLSRKGLPWRSWLHLTRRHGGLLWPLLFAWPYLKVMAQGIVPSKAKQRPTRLPA